MQAAFERKGAQHRLIDGMIDTRVDRKLRSSVSLSADATRSTLAIVLSETQTDVMCVLLMMMFGDSVT